jgi:hypothetical protein
MREWLEGHGVSHVMATRCDHAMTTRADRTARADTLIAELPVSR